MTPYSNKLIKWLNYKNFGIDQKLELLKIIQNAPVGATHINTKGVYARSNLNTRIRVFVYINKKWVQGLDDSSIFKGSSWISLNEIRDYLVQHLNADI
jgi:hypothetical protein